MPTPSPGPAKKGRSVWLRLVLLAVAAPLLVFAVMRIYSIIVEEFYPQLPSHLAGQNASGPSGGAAPNDPESGASHSRVSVHQGGNANNSRPIVALGMPVSAGDSGLTAIPRSGILQRELFRQAFLIAARDELGLITRDLALGEPYGVSKPQGDATPEILTISGVGGLIRAVVRQAGAGGETYLDRELSGKATGSDKSAGDEATPENLAKLVERTEELSRTELPGVLRKIGVDGKPNATKADAAVPETIENRLSGTRYVNVFAALRDLHELIRSDGESLARVGALVRGYALLGLLSEFQWHPAHKAYKARSLLYAQRLVARDPKGTWGLWHRAYALALVGLHQDALNDLAAAEARSKTDGKVARPSWVDLIAAVARCDAKALEKKDGPHAKLASLLRLTLLEFPALPNVTLPAASDVLKLEPDCYRAIDAMCIIRAVSTLHVATLLGPQALEQTLPQQLKLLEKLPAAVRASLEKAGNGSVELATALEQADASTPDAGELSWAALAHLVRETQFVHVYRRLFFMKLVWDVPIDEFWADARGWVVGHPLLPLLDWFATPPNAATTSIESVVKRLDTMNLDSTATALLLANAQGGGRDRTATVSRLMASHDDHIVRDISLEIRNADDLGGSVNYAKSARLLFAVSPQSPYAKATLIEKDWAYSQSHLAEWEKEAGGSPTLLGAIARRYDKMGKVDDSTRLLSEYIKLSPDRWAFDMLAANYKKQGNEARWLAVMEQFLEEGGDPGLDSAHFRVQIANHYMNQKLWEKARPYADAAATTGAAWAMACAQKCAEGRKDWSQAEQWARAISERYPSTSWAQWYFLCVQSGHGDAVTARAFADQWVSGGGVGESPNDQESLAWFYLTSGEPKKALPIFRKLYESGATTHRCAMTWLVADLIDDGATRNEYFKFMDVKHRSEAPKTAKLWQCFQQAIDRDDGQSFDLKAIEQYREGAEAMSLCVPDLMIGLFLEKHGKPIEARRFLALSAENPTNFGWPLAVARNSVRKLDRGEKDRKAESKDATDAPKPKT